MGPNPRRGALVRRTAIALVLVSVLAGCRPFGPGMPICGDLEVASSGDLVRATVTRSSGEIHELRSSHVIQMQAVPSAEFGPCIVELPRSWMLVMPEPRSGEVALQFHSPALGGTFMTVALLDVCEPTSAARRIDTPHDATQRWVEIHDRTRGLAVAVVPVAARHEQAAYELATDLTERELRGSRLRVSLSNVVHGPADERIAARLDEGAAVIVVDDDLSLRDELELRLPDLAGPINGTFGSVLTELADRTEAPRYEATWWEVADGSCTRYEIGAEGADAASLESEIDAVIGRFPVGELRRGFADHGYVIDPGP